MYTKIITVDEITIELIRWNKRLSTIVGKGYLYMVQLASKEIFQLN